MKVKIFETYDEYDCEDCGWSGANGFMVFDSETEECVLHLKAAAHCYAGTTYSFDDLLKELGEKFPDLKVSDLEYETGETILEEY